MCSHPDRDELARFFSKVRIASAGCWFWTGAKNPNGYGVFGCADGSGRSAHRVIYIWFVRQVDDDEQIDHLCFNRSCVNPVHLDAVSPTENARRSNHRRWSAPTEPLLDAMDRPPTHPGEIFEEEYRKPSGISQAEAARRMGMSTVRLNQIVGGNRGVTPATAVLFSMLTDTDPMLWLRLQAEYDLWHVIRETRGKVKHLAAAAEGD